MKVYQPTCIISKLYYACNHDVKVCVYVQIGVNYLRYAQIRCLKILVCNCRSELKTTCLGGRGIR